MANLARSAVTVTETWREGGTNARKFKAVAATIALTGQGTTTDGARIEASVFGMNKIWSVRDARTSANAAVLAWPSYDGSYVLLTGVTAGEGNGFTTNALTATVKMTVLGKD